MKCRYNRKPFEKTDKYANFRSLKELHIVSDRYLFANDFFHALRKYAFTLGDERYRQLHEQALRGDVEGAKLLFKHTLSNRNVA